MAPSEPNGHTDNFVHGFHEERTENPYAHPIVGAYRRKAKKVDPPVQLKLVNPIFPNAGKPFTGIYDRKA